MKFNYEPRYFSTFLSFFLLLAGCTTPPPQPESLDFRARAETQSEAGVKVSTAVLSPQETLHHFSLPLAEKGIQPVWIEIQNQADESYSLMLLSIDPEYYSPSEVAWMFQDYDDSGDDENENPMKNASLEDLIDVFLEKHVPVTIFPHSTVSGFVYTHLDPGAKAFSVDLIGDQDRRAFEFVQLVPGFAADYMRVDFDHLYRADQVQNLNLASFRKYLENLPCCVLGGDQKTPGDPLNLVIVGKGTYVLATLVRRGWDLTEEVRSDTVWQTVSSSLFGTKYRTSPVSPLYLFGRTHDAALQKARSTVDERNHLRLWRAPVTLDGQMVWVGQISRDIGVKFSSKTFVTHKIDPIIDEARLYITLDLAEAQTLRAYGYTKGVGHSDRKNPHYNYTGDPYYTDGLRVVLILGEERQSLDKIEYLKWEQPNL